MWTMKVIFCLIILQVTKCSAYDLEIEGVMRVGEEFLKKLRDDLKETHKLLITPQPPSKFIPPLQVYAGASKEGKKSRKTGVNLKTNKPYLNKVISSFDRMKTDGTLEIEKLEDTLNENLRVESNLTDLIPKACDEYSTTLDKYFESITHHVGNTQVEIEFLLLDLVETSNKIVYSLQKRMLNEVLDGNKREITKANINKVTQKLYRQNVFDKKRQMGLICEEHNVCRPFPGFIDYFAVFMGEILKLSEDRLQIFCKTFKKALNNHINYIQQIINVRALNALGYHWNNLSGDVGIIRDLLSILRTMMAQRHKVIGTDDDRLKNRTTAVKILFDIIDKAFENDGEELVSLNIDIVVETLRHWTSRHHDVESIVASFVKYFFNMMEQSISENTKNEMKVLTEVILRGKSNNNSIYKYLLKKGSKLVRGEDVYIYGNFI